MLLETDHLLVRRLVWILNTIWIDLSILQNHENHKQSIRFGWNDRGLLLLAGLVWEKNTVLAYNLRSFTTQRTGCLVCEDNDLATWMASCPLGRESCELQLFIESSLSCHEDGRNWASSVNVQCTQHFVRLASSLAEPLPSANPLSSIPLNLSQENRTVV